MTRFSRLCLLIVSVLSLCLTPSFAQQTQSPAQQKRPNILMILFDDVGFSGIGAYGGEVNTPRIDQIAKQGTVLARYYTSPFCGPTRAMLMTGMDNHQVGMGTLVETLTESMKGKPGYSMRWQDDQKTIGTLLSKAGYQTYVSGKWGIGEIGANLPHRFGFQRSYVMDATGGGNYDDKPYLPGSHAVDWFEDGKRVTLPQDFYSSRTLVDKMISYVDEGDRDRPFFGFLALQAAHMPIQVPAEYTKRYDGVFDKGYDVMREEQLKRAIALGLVPPTTKLAPVPKAHKPWNDLSAKQKAVSAREMQVNAGMMEAADEHIGRLLDHLQKTGQLENTIVMVLSDNGAESGQTRMEGPANLGLDLIKMVEGFDASFENLGLRNSLTAVGPEWASVLSAPFHLYKFYGSEGGLRVPFVISGPGISQSGIKQAPVHVADLVPTVLEAAGVSYDPAQFYGRSVLPMLSGKSETTYGDTESFAFEVSGNAALYRGNWKITRNTEPHGDNQWRLYDLSVDPGETTDLSASNKALFDEMLAEYASYAQKVGIVEIGPDDNAMKALNSNLIEKVMKKYMPSTQDILTFLIIFAGVVFILGLVIYFTLPKFLALLGLHRHYTIPDFDLKGRRALVVCTNHTRLDPLKRDTGAFGSEFTVPYYAFINANMDVDMASPKGGVIPIQPPSWSWPLACHDDYRFMKDKAAMAKLKSSYKITDLDPADYDVIFMAGGWGAAYDLMQSEELADFVTRANAHGVILGSVCHGALGLCSAKGVDGELLVKGRRVTGVTDAQINTFGIAVTPKHPETELRKAGAIYECQHGWLDPFMTHTTIDGNLITGQNQNSGYETAHRILEKMATKRNS